MKELEEMLQLVQKKFERITNLYVVEEFWNRSTITGLYIGQ